MELFRQFMDNAEFTRWMGDVVCGLACEGPVPKSSTSQ